MSHVHYYTKQPHERWFFTTDIHGSFDLLHEKLKEVSFDTSKDKLFVGGDNTDRGVDSKYILDYINEPWFISVRANHEEMFIAAYEEGFSDCGNASRMLYFNGGEWAFDLDSNTQRAVYESFKSLPLAVELDTGREKIGIVHAEVPMSDWNQFKAMTKAELDYRYQSVAQWARIVYDRRMNINIKGVDRVLVGHTPTTSGEVEVLGNIHYCDLGSFFRHKICFIEL